MRVFDCHSHWSTERGYIFQDPKERANQEKIWGTTAEFQTEQEMTDTFRKNNVRTVLDLALTVWMDDLDEIKAAHDYTFEVQRRNSDVIFGHWLSFDPRIGKDGIKEYERAIAADAGFIGFGIIGQTAGGLPASDPIWDPFYKPRSMPVFRFSSIAGSPASARVCPAARASCLMTATPATSMPSPRDSPSSKSSRRAPPTPGRTK